MPGGIYEGLDAAVMERATRELAFSFMAGSKATLRRMANDDALTLPMVTAAVVKAHLAGAASMIAAAEPPVDPLLLVAWLIEALGEALADVAAVAGEPQ